MTLHDCMSGIHSVSQLQYKTLGAYQGLGRGEHILLGKDHAGSLLLNGLHHSWVAVPCRRDTNTCTQSLHV